MANFSVDPQSCFGPAAESPSRQGAAPQGEALPAAGPAAEHRPAQPGVCGRLAAVRVGRGSWARAIPEFSCPSNTVARWVVLEKKATEALLPWVHQLWYGFSGVVRWAYARRLRILGFLLRIGLRVLGGLALICAVWLTVCFGIVGGQPWLS